MALNIASVKNLLIDLGGVLYEIQVQKTLQAYYDLIPSQVKQQDPKKLFHNPLFKKLDQGEIEIDELAVGLIKEWQLDVKPDVIKQVWLDLLVGLYPNRIELIQELSKTYHIALLSNTSRYHYQHYIEECKPMFEAMDELFFSFDMGLTKPDAAIFHRVLEQMQWKADETLFLDDSPSNIKGAEKLGLQTYLIQQAEDFEKIANSLLKTE